MVICIHTLQEYTSQNKSGAYIYSLLWIAFTFNIFVFCYIGDLLTQKVEIPMSIAYWKGIESIIESKSAYFLFLNLQCDSIGDVAYMVDWYQLSPQDARNLVLIVASTLHPVVLTAGKMSTLSLRSFSNVSIGKISLFLQLKKCSWLCIQFFNNNIVPSVLGIKSISDIFEHASNSNY